MLRLRLATVLEIYIPGRITRLHLLYELEYVHSDRLFVFCVGVSCVVVWCRVAGNASAFVSIPILGVVARGVGCRERKLGSGW